MIRIEKFTKSDIQDFLTWLSGTDTRFLIQFSGPFYHFPLDEKQLLETLEMEDTIVFKAVETSTNRMVGHGQLIRINRAAKSAAIGKVLINPAMQSKGYGSAMIVKLIEYARNNLQIEQFSLRVFDFNTPAIHCYKKLGFTETSREDIYYKEIDETWVCITMNYVPGEDKRIK